MNSRASIDSSFITIEDARHVAESTWRIWVEARIDENRMTISFRPSGNPSEVLRVIVRNESKILCVLVHDDVTGENVPLYRANADLTILRRLMEKPDTYEALGFGKEDDIPEFSHRSQQNDKKMYIGQEALRLERQIRDIVFFAFEELESIPNNPDYHLENLSYEVPDSAGSSPNGRRDPIQSLSMPRSDGELPPEVLVQVLRHVDVRSIRTARNVCREWRAVVDINSADLWEARCFALDLLPNTVETFLGRVAKYVEVRVKVARGFSKQKGDRWANDEVVAIYRHHYLTFKPYICQSCEPSDAAEIKANKCCTHPKDFRWLDLHYWAELNMKIGKLSRVVRHPYVPRRCGDVAVPFNDVVRFLDLSIVDLKDKRPLLNYVKRHMGS